MCKHDFWVPASFTLFNFTLLLKGSQLLLFPPAWFLTSFSLRGFPKEIRYWNDFLKSRLDVLCVPHRRSLSSWFCLCFSSATFPFTRNLFLFLIFFRFSFMNDLERLFNWVFSGNPLLFLYFFFSFLFFTFFNKKKKNIDIITPKHLSNEKWKGR
jgi:hypothetical protein